MDIFKALNLKQNKLSELVIETVTGFPADSYVGRLIYHETHKAIFVCINGKAEGADTTLKGNWKGGKITLDDLDSAGQPLGKVLVTDGLGNFTYENCDGGEI